jgi:hypothetical protein
VPGDGVHVQRIVLQRLLEIVREVRVLPVVQLQKKDCFLKPPQVSWNHVGSSPLTSSPSSLPLLSSEHGNTNVEKLHPSEKEKPEHDHQSTLLRDPTLWQPGFTRHRLLTGLIIVQSEFAVPMYGPFTGHSHFVCHV